MPWPLRMISYAGIIVLIVLVYFGYRYFTSLKILNLKHVWLFGSFYALMVILFLAYPLAGHFEYRTQGNFTRTGYPDIVIYLYWYGVVCMGVMFNWLLLHDLLKPLVTWLSGKNPLYISRLFASLFLIAAGLTVIYTAGKLIRDTNQITVEKISYNLNTGLAEPLTIVHIADLHADTYTREQKLNRYIRKVNEANPDLVVFAGDLISSGRDHIKAGADALAGIESTYGTWFVMGDHDYWVGTEEIADSLELRGINVLRNENAIIRHGQTIIKITGITELYSYRIDGAELTSLLESDKGEHLHILVSHQATDRLINAAHTSGVHQLLAGHTHGGQLRVPFFFYPVTPARVESRYVKGHWRIGEMLLNINNGLGFTLAPVRYNAPAQVSVIKVE
jgi:uncharacterized protein